MKIDEEFWQSVTLNVIWKWPVFSMVIARMRFHPSTAFPTAAVDIRGNTYYNPQFIAGLDLQGWQFVLAHEAMHLMTYSFDRRHGRLPMRWNMASDRAINQLLRSMGFVIPEWALLPKEEHVDWSTEQLYDIEDSKAIKVDMPGGGCGVIETTASEEELSRYAMEWRSVVEQAVDFAKHGGRGSSDASIGAFLKFFELPPSRVKYSSIFRKTSITTPRNSPPTPTWNRPNRRTHGTPLILPGNIKHGISVAVLIDTSGSMSDDSIRQAISETVAITKATKSNVWLVTHDSEVQFVGWVSKRPPDEACKGRGGTLFKPAYQAVAAVKHRFDYLIHLTDGLPCDAWPSLPRNVQTGIVALLGYKDKSSIPVKYKVIEAEI